MNELNDADSQKLREMLETWDDIHRAARVLKFIGYAAKWVFGIGASAAVFWAAVHGGNPK